MLETLAPPLPLLPSPSHCVFHRSMVETPKKHLLKLPRSSKHQAKLTPKPSSPSPLTPVTPQTQTVTPRRSSCLNSPPFDPPISIEEPKETPRSGSSTQTRSIELYKFRIFISEFQPMLMYLFRVSSLSTLDIYKTYFRSHHTRIQRPRVYFFCEKLLRLYAIGFCN